MNKINTYWTFFGIVLVTMDIHQCCHGTTLQGMAIKLKLKQNEKIFLKIMKHNRYQQNTPEMFIICLSYQIAHLTILLSMELFKTVCNLLPNKGELYI